MLEFRYRIDFKAHTRLSHHLHGYASKNRVEAKIDHPESIFGMVKKKDLHNKMIHKSTIIKITSIHAVKKRKSKNLPQKLDTHHPLH